MYRNELSDSTTHLVLSSIFITMIFLSQIFNQVLPNGEELNALVEVFIVGTHGIHERIDVPTNVWRLTRFQNS